MITNSKSTATTLFAISLVALLALSACGKPSATKDEQAAAAEATTEAAEHAHASDDHAHSDEAEAHGSAGHDHAEGEKGAH